MVVAFTDTGFFRNRQAALRCSNSLSKTSRAVPRPKFFQQMNQRKETRMKTKVYWLALLASAAIVSQTQAHGFGGGGGGFGGAHLGGGFGGGHVGGRPAFHSAPIRSVAGVLMSYCH